MYLSEFTLSKETMDSIAESICYNKYKLLDKNVGSISDMKMSNKKVAKTMIDNSSNIQIQIDRQLDSYFWVYYIVNKMHEKDKYIVNDYDEEKKTFENMQKLKFELINKLREEKYAHKYKELKIKKVLLENDIVNDKQMSLHSLLDIFKVFEINVIIDIKNIWLVSFDMKDNIDDEQHIMKVEMDVDVKKNIEFKECKMCDLRIECDAHYIIDNLSKPLRNISAYNKEEVFNIAKLLGLSIEYLHKNGQIKFKTKKDLYQECGEYIKSYIL